MRPTCRLLGVVLLGVVLLDGGLATGGVSAQPTAPSSGHVDPPCFDNTHRYVDCGNGTVTDTVTGLVWLRDASCLGRLDWATAHEDASELAAGRCGLTDGSPRGAWRLPTLLEWRATIARAVTLGCTTPGRGRSPTLTTDTGTGCLADGTSPFIGVEAGPYWSASADEPQPVNAWVVSLEETVHGHVYRALKSFPLPAWPVRDR